MKLPNLNKNIYKKGHVILGSEILKAFLLGLGRRQGCQLSPRSSHIVLTALARKINKRHMVLKGRSKTLMIFRWYDCIWRGKKESRVTLVYFLSLLDINQVTRQKSAVECKLKSLWNTATCPSELLKWTETSMQNVGIYMKQQAFLYTGCGTVTLNNYFAKLLSSI